MLDVLLPTMRWNSYVKGYLNYLVDILPDNVTLHIGDNSCDPVKHEFLETLEKDNVKVYLHRKNLGTWGNWTYLVENSKNKFVLSLADDDWISPDVFKHAQFLNDNPNYTACAGNLVAYPPKHPGIANFKNDYIDESRAIKYIALMLQHDVNWLALATIRRDCINTYVKYLKAHPYRLYFQDQMLSQIVLLAGPIKGISSGLTVYKNRLNGEMPQHWENLTTLLEDQGLPVEFYRDKYYFWLACEYAALYRYLSRSKEEANLIFNRVSSSHDCTLKDAFKHLRTQIGDHSIYDL